MDPTSRPIVRRDFPRAVDGYDRAAVDAHLEALAAAAGEDPSTARGAVGGAPPTDHDVLAAGRLILGQITALRVELKHVSSALREHGVTISDALEELLDPGAGPDDRLLAAAPLPASAPTPLPAAAAAAASPPDRTPPMPAIAPAAAPAGEVAAAASPPGPAAPMPAAAPAEGAAAAPAQGAAAAPAEEAATAASPPDRAAPMPAAAPALRATASPAGAAASSPPDGKPDPAEADRSAAIEDARLVALDLALGGRSRAEIERELARFDLPDRAGLVDAVLAAIA